MVMARQPGAWRNWVGTRGMTMANRVGTNGNDILNGTNDNDFFWGLGGNDTMYGGFGNDTFFASEGSDIMIGGLGSDTVSYASIVAEPVSNLNTNGVQASLKYGFGHEVSTGVDDYYSGIENLTGSNYNDYLQGDGNANIIRGLAGHDRISGGAGGDTLEGGAGTDSLLYTDSSARVVVDLLNNTARGGDAEGDVISGFENLQGSAFNDVLSGTNGANVISGENGNDTINARGGDDTVWAGAGDDYVNGGDGNDELYGAEGNDTMIGGAGNDSISANVGNDIMTGGTGSDTFKFSNWWQTGSDKITDFDVSNDTIEYSGGGSFGVGIANLNPYNFTCDIVVAFSNGGSVVLEDMHISLVDDVIGRIELT
jgi:Ca2+-binding RTX toxin-like protein